MKNILWIALIASLALLILSSFMLVYSLQKPDVIKSSYVKYRYSLIGKYDYSIKLRPNLLYNQTYLLNPSVVFFKIADIVNINLTFKVSSRNLKDVKGVMNTYLIIGQIPFWNKTIDSRVLSINSSSISFSRSINLTSIIGLIRDISDSIGVSSNRYFIRIAARANVNLTIGDEKVSEVLPTYLDITINTQSNTVTFSDRMFKIDRTIPTFKISENYMTFLGIRLPVKSFKILSMILLGVSTPSALTSAIMYIKRCRGKVSRLRKIIEEYENLIIDVVGENSIEQSETLIEVARFEDLVKLAEGLGRPILHVEIPNKDSIIHKFYVNNERVIYKHTVEEKKTQ